MVRKEGTLEAKGLSEEATDLGFVLRAPLAAELRPPLVMEVLLRPRLTQVRLWSLLVWMEDQQARELYHVIRQQLMQRGPRRLFRAPFFFLGVKIAMMASSNTVFRPFWVKAEHST